MGMAYHDPTHILMCFASLITVAFADVNTQSFAEIAVNCCPEDTAKCCADSIEQQKPLNCSLSFEGLVAASDCIQKSLFGAKSLEISRIEDVECCRVFFEANREMCVSTCVEELRTPSLRSTEKLKVIKSCRSNDEYFQCFRRCQSFLRSRQIPSEKFPHLAVCDLVQRLEYGELYIGPELKD